MIRAVVWFLLVVSFNTWANTFDTFEFDDPQLQERFVDLTKQLRCPKCQNQNLADSNSPIAADLRRAVYKQLQTGKNDQQIQTYMVERFGEFVLYEPKVKTSTYLLWYGPAGLLILGGLFGIRVFRRRKQAQNEIQPNGSIVCPVDDSPLSGRGAIGMVVFIIGFSALTYSHLGAWQQASDYVNPKARMLAEQAQYLYDTHGQQMTPQIKSLVDAALEIDPNDPATHVLLGMHYFADGQFKQAIEHWQKVVQSNRTDIDKEALQMAIDEAKSRL